MSQESKIINVYLVKEDKKDYLVFEFKKKLQVCLNDDNCQSNLKAVFSKLLMELLESPVKLEFKDIPEYKTMLYVDVCKEYIKELNRELNTVRKNIPEGIQIPS